MKYLLALIAAALLLSAIVANVLGAELKGFTCLDGDTVRGDIHLGFDVVLRDQTIRIADFDAWETSRRRQTVTIDNAELEKGQRAKEALAKMLHEAKRVEVVESGNGDPYGRRSCAVYADGVNVADVLRKGGHERK